MTNSLISTFTDKEKIELIKKTVAKDATDDELLLFMHIAKQSGLDPFAKQIYAIKRGGVMSYQASIDGLRLTADRTGKYSPGREPIFEKDEKGHLVSATAFVKKQTSDGTWHEVAAKVYFCEYNKNQGLWKSLPHTMLAKVAESHALRKAFPAELGALYSEDEMDQADKKQTIDTAPLDIIDVSPTTPVKEKEQKKPEKQGLPSEPLTTPQVEWAKKQFAEIGITFDDIQQEWGCPNLVELLQCNLKDFMNKVKAKWGNSANRQIATAKS